MDGMHIDWMWAQPRPAVVDGVRVHSRLLSSSGKPLDSAKFFLPATFRPVELNTFVGEIRRAHDRVRPPHAVCAFIPGAADACGLRSAGQAVDEHYTIGYIDLRGAHALILDAKTLDSAFCAALESDGQQLRLNVRVRYNARANIAWHHRDPIT